MNVGFRNYNGYNKDIKCIKYVLKSDVSEFYSISPYVIYKGYKAYIFGQRDESVSITIENLRPDEAEVLKMDRAVDNGIYEKWLKKKDIVIYEEKVSKLIK